MGIRVEGLDDLLVRLDQDIHMLDTCARNGRCGDEVQTQVSRLHQRVFAERGRNLSETEGRMPWGVYARDRGADKQAGQTYTLIDTGDLIFSMIDVYAMVRVQTERVMEFGSDVEYAGIVNERWGAIVGADEQFPADVERAIEEWFVSDSRLPWVREVA